IVWINVRLQVVKTEGNSCPSASVALSLPCRTTTAFRWVRGLCGAPDAPHAPIKRSANDQSGGQCVGSAKSAHPIVVSGSQSALNLEKENSAGPLWITFRVRNSAHVLEAMLLDRKLVLPLPEEGLPEGSKEAVTELLEFAEEQLKATEVIVSLAKDRQDRMVIIRTLMYLGFEALAPDSPLLPPETVDPNHYFMCYSI
ncbi:ornithine decarboxylase antizyme 1, partial [Galendromus occidentalis]|uniref:Ornithine decarboxylase antizyme n=1 Tax=Galendromus occidentalis TaxID=34638 RepID=A0AAJ6QU73_9ACAR